MHEARIMKASELLNFTGPRNRKTVQKRKSKEGPHEWELRKGPAELGRTVVPHSPCSSSSSSKDSRCRLTCLSHLSTTSPTHHPPPDCPTPPPTPTLIQTTPTKPPPPRLFFSPKGKKKKGKKTRHPFLIFISGYLH